MPWATRIAEVSFGKMNVVLDSLWRGTDFSLTRIIKGNWPNPRKTNANAPYYRYSCSFTSKTGLLET
jgi:hypothetical protein